MSSVPSHFFYLFLHNSKLFRTFATKFLLSMSKKSKKNTLYTIILLVLIGIATLVAELITTSEEKAVSTTVVAAALVENCLAWSTTSPNRSSGILATRLATTPIGSCLTGSLMN